MRATLAALLLLSTPIVCATEPSAALDALLSQLAQPVPASTPFVEQRASALLSEPLVLRGRLEQPDADTLLRIVESPYRERSSIRDKRVELQREGESTRRFALRRAPELAALLDAFRAVLQGDRALLERHYALQFEGAIDGAWRLQLSPLESRRKQRVTGIELLGESARLDCLIVRQAEGGDSRMLLGEVALDEATALEVRFARHCVAAAPAP